ncbi:hypothetical protein ACFWVB_33345 [Streptomyces microflavus]|uniref:hypothetical protein n=1 Tax=Streptomyces microflavus TaxID=1919 RepID=UPI003668C1EB
MTHAFYSDAAEKILRTDLSPGEQAAVESARRLIEEDPDSERARGLPEMASFAAGLTIPEPGLGPINRWYPEGETGPDVIQWGYVAYKQR